MEDKEKFEPMGTKISPYAAEVWNAICEAKGTDTYHMLQAFIGMMIRAASGHHDVNPEIQKLLTLMEQDAGWQKAFNIANPSKMKVAQVVLILEQEGHKGFGAVMVDKPWMGESRMTECSDDILERITEVTMYGIYRRLRMMGAEMGCTNLSDVLLTMLDAQTMIELDERFREEMPGDGDRAENGRPYAYGKRTKQTKRRTPDSIQQRIVFGDEDKRQADEESER